LAEVEAGETVVRAAELEVPRRRIRELQRLLGKKTLAAEILKEAVEVARERKWIARSPLLPGDDR
jgi:transposase